MYIGNTYIGNEHDVYCVMKERLGIDNWDVDELVDIFVREKMDALNIELKAVTREARRYECMADAYFNALNELDCLLDEVAGSKISQKVRALVEQMQDVCREYC